MSLLVSLSLAAFGVFLYQAEERQIRGDALAERQAILKNLIHVAREAFIGEDDLMLVKYVGLLPKWTPGVISAAIIDRDGYVLAHSDPHLIGRNEMLPRGNISESVRGPIKKGSQWVATAEVRFSRDQIERDVEERLNELQRRLLTVALWSVVLGAALAFGVAYSWSGSINQLSRLAAEIGEGTRSVSLDRLADRRDEIGGLARAFEAMAGRLQELDRLKEDFVSAVTHELRSPLAAIESYLNVVSDEISRGESSANWVGYVERIRVNTTRLFKFVNDLLDVSALERGAVPYTPASFDLSALCREVCGFFALKLGYSGLELKLDLPDHGVTVSGDAEKIRQVIINLLSNAIKFTPAGGTIEIQITPDPAGGLQRFSIRDSGAGIAEADQRRIFDKFEQVAQSRRTVPGPKGTGLGLAISKALIELHGQKLELNSTFGAGSSFSFALPAAGDQGGIG